MSTTRTGDGRLGAAALPAREERVHHGARDHAGTVEGTVFLTLYYVHDPVLMI